MLRNPDVQSQLLGWVSKNESHYNQPCIISLLDSHIYGCLKDPLVTIPPAPLGVKYLVFWLRVPPRHWHCLLLLRQFTTLYSGSSVPTRIPFRSYRSLSPVTIVRYPETWVPGSTPVSPERSIVDDTQISANSFVSSLGGLHESGLFYQYKLTTSTDSCQIIRIKNFFNLSQTQVVPVGGGVVSVVVTV